MNQESLHVAATAIKGSICSIKKSRGTPVCYSLIISALDPGWIFVHWGLENLEPG